MYTTGSNSVILKSFIHLASFGWILLSITSQKQFPIYYRLGGETACSKKTIVLMNGLKFLKNAESLICWAFSDNILVNLV